MRLLSTRVVACTVLLGCGASAGEGSTVEVVDDSAVYTLRNLSKLNACPAEATANSLTGCVR